MKKLTRQELADTFNMYCFMDNDYAVYLAENYPIKSSTTGWGWCGEGADVTDLTDDTSVNWERSVCTPKSKEILKKFKERCCGDIDSTAFVLADNIFYSLPTKGYGTKGETRGTAYLTPYSHVDIVVNVDRLYIVNKKELPAFYLAVGRENIKDSDAFFEKYDKLSELDRLFKGEN